jgi:hypothetical protein
LNPQQPGIQTLLTYEKQNQGIISVPVIIGALIFCYELTLSSVRTIAYQAPSEVKCEEDKKSPLPGLYLTKSRFKFITTMNHWQRTQLIADLENSTPLVGWWVQRRAASRLAKDPTNRSTLALAQAALNHADSGVRRIAQRSIERVSNQASIDAVCHVWRQTRHPWLAKLITANSWIAAKPDDLRVLSALQANQIEWLVNGKASQLAILVQVASEEKDVTLVQRASNALGLVEKPASIDALWTAWFETRLPVLEKIILDKNKLARKPAEIRLVSILKTGRPEMAHNLPGALVSFVLQLAHDNDGDLSASARLILENLTQEDARQALCQQVIDPGDTIAKVVALKQGYLPQQDAQKAIFLLITEQWEAYHILDFDQRYLQLSYQAAPASLRKRILDAIRRGGQTQLLSAIAGNDFRSHVAALSKPESHTLVQILAEAQAWQKLWDSLPELPYSAALQAMRSLFAHGWQPQDFGEQEVFVHLARLAHSEIEESSNKIRSAIPPAILRAKIHLRKGRLNDLCFAPHQPTLAIAASNRKIILWNLRSGEIQQVLNGYSRSVGQVAYSGDGRLVSAERSRENQHPCWVYLHDGEQMKPIWQISGPVTALVPWQQHGLLVSGRDGTLTLLNLDQENARVNTLQLQDWPRGICLPAASDLALLWGRSLIWVSLPSLMPVEHLQQARFIHNIPNQVTLLPQQNLLYLGFSNGSLQGYQMPEMSAVYPELPAHTAPVKAIEALPGSKTWLSASSQGDICFNAWPDPDSPGKTVQHAGRLTALRLSSDGAILATCDQASNLLIWDCRPLQIPQLLEQPLGLGTTAHLSAMQGLSEQPGFPPAIANAIEFLHTLLRFRFRYAVELSQAAELQAGEFDIHLS